MVMLRGYKNLDAEALLRFSFAVSILSHCVALLAVISSFRGLARFSAADLAMDVAVSDTLGVGCCDLRGAEMGLQYQALRGAWGPDARPDSTLAFRFMCGSRVGDVDRIYAAPAPRQQGHMAGHLALVVAVVYPRVTHRPFGHDYPVVLNRTRRGACSGRSAGDG